MKWIGLYRPPLCTYRLNWAMRSSWGWWDEWDDTVLQTQDSKFKPWWFEAEYATSRSRRLPAILSFTRGWGRNIFVSFKPPRPWTEPRTLAWNAAPSASSNACPTFLLTGVKILKMRCASTFTSSLHAHVLKSIKQDPLLSFPGNWS